MLLDHGEVVVEYSNFNRCFEVASLNKVERAFSNAFFTKPPESSYEEALAFFETAYKVLPKYFAATPGYLALCHKKLGNKEKAKEFAKIAMEFSDLDEQTVRVAQFQFNYLCRFKRSAPKF